MPQKFSLPERMLMAQNFQLLALSDPANRRHWEHCEEIVRQGYEGLYWVLTDSFAKDDEIVTHEESRYVFDVLQMFDRIRMSIDHQKIELDERQIYRAKFEGFDGNSEGKLLGFANTYCDPSRYNNLKQDGEIPNSHGPVRHRYERMLPIYADMDKSEGLLTAEQLQILLSV